MTASRGNDYGHSTHEDAVSAHARGHYKLLMRPTGIAGGRVWTIKKERIKDCDTRHSTHYKDSSLKDT